VVAGLERLDAAAGCRNARAVRASCPPAPSRTELHRIAVALAVLLHESLHATGPRDLVDFRDTPSGRAFEEGFTEAATMDLLPRFVRSLDLPADLQRAVLSAVGRYRPAYPRQVAWARELSIEATRSRASSAAPRAWRVGVTDRWGADRWHRLARATGRSEATLRGEVPQLPSDRPRR
jgi:hypothetical protein